MSTNGTGKATRLPAATSGGRIPSPAHSRGVFSKRLIEDLTIAWERDGADSLRILAKEHPDRFSMLAFSILPRDTILTIEQNGPPGGLSSEDWVLLLKVLDLVKAAEIEAGPAEVFSVLETALRSHYAKPIEAS